MKELLVQGAAGAVHTHSCVAWGDSRAMSESIE
jgi:hypothetical protein